MSKTVINYIEFKASNLEAIKDFYASCFGWKFTDYGPAYIAFSESGLEGGFELTQDAIVNGALVVLYHTNLEIIQKIIQDNGGIISKPVFSFPGGRRFHFLDPSGNELAIWSDQ